MTVGRRSGELEKDENHDGFLGLSEYLCLVGGAHLSRPAENVDRYICLNACHLGAAGARRFSDHIKRAMEGGK